jgi:hypothetical protein
MTPVVIFLIEIVAFGTELPEASMTTPERFAPAN